MAASHLTIKTPRPTTFESKDVKGKLVWDSSWAGQFSGQLERAQIYVDSEVLRVCAAYMPFMTGQLIQSGVIGTKVGSGMVTYVAPYATAQYYSMRSRSYDGQRGGWWFERAMADHKNSILAGARRASGGK